MYGALTNWAVPALNPVAWKHAENSEAKALYRRASDLGFKGADHQISRLETPGSGLLPPKKVAPAVR